MNTLKAIVLTTVITTSALASNQPYNTHPAPAKYSAFDFTPKDEEEKTMGLAFCGVSALLVSVMAYRVISAAQMKKY